MFSDVIALYRASLLSDEVNERRAMHRIIAELAKTEHANFVRLCRDLLDDPQIEVRQRILFFVMRFGDRDDAVTESRVLAALTVPELQARSILALGTVGTARAFPILWDYAQARSPIGLRAASNQVRTSGQRAQVLELARRFMLVPGAAATDLREECLQVLLRLSTILEELDVLLAVARRFTEDDVIWLLGNANVDANARAAIATELRAIQTDYPEDCVEYKSLSYAIATLEQQRAT